MKKLWNVVSPAVLFLSAFVLTSCGHDFWTTSTATNPSGAVSKFVFVANNGGGSLSEYTVGTTGALTSISGSPISVASGVVSVAANSAGTLVFAVSANS